MPIVTKRTHLKKVEPKRDLKLLHPKSCVIGCIGIFCFMLLLLISAFYVAWRVLSEQIATLKLPANPTIDVLTGVVEKKSSNKWIKVISGEALSEGDSVRSAGKSEAQITFPTGTQLRLDENTEISIKPTSRGTSVYQSQGRTWSRIGNKIGTQEIFELESPSLIATVRGTAFSTTVSKSDTQIEVADGVVEIAAIDRSNGGRLIAGRTTVTEDNFIRVSNADIEEFRTDKKTIFTKKTPDETKNSEWFEKNIQRDKNIVQSLSGHAVSPLNIFQLARTIQPEDFAKLQNFYEKLESGEIKPTMAQEQELSYIAERFASATVLDETLAADTARVLATLDPENFSDTQHWTKVLTELLPYINLFQDQTDQ